MIPTWVVDAGTSFFKSKEINENKKNAVEGTCKNSDIIRFDIPIDL
jgi:hypothetical protein